MNLGRLHWSLYFLFWVAAIGAAGAALGALLFPVVGWLFRVGPSLGQLARHGAFLGGYFFLIWAPGTAVVLCVIRAYRRRHPEVS